MIWYVVFHPKRPEHWWARRFGHVSLMGYERETWVHVDLGRHGVQTEIFHTYDDVTEFLSYMLHYHTVVRAPVCSAPRFHFARPLTCVAMVKHTIGLPSRALLPDGLFRTLTRDFNAEIANENPESPKGNGGTAHSASARGTG